MLFNDCFKSCSPRNTELITAAFHRRARGCDVKSVIMNCNIVYERKAQVYAPEPIYNHGCAFIHNGLNYNGPILKAVYTCEKHYLRS